MTVAYFVPKGNPKSGEEHQLALFDEYSLYHNAGNGGYFSLCWRPESHLKQRSYRLSQLPEVIRYVNPNLDTYLSQAEFFRPNRRVVNLLRLGLCFVDIDYYNSDFAHHKPDQVAGAILEYCNDIGIPLPSVLLYSGRGIYAKWIFETAIPRLALPRWDALQGKLVSLLSRFGADKKARDASRILRLENTVNTKSGEVCRVMYPLHDNPVVYDFEELCREILPKDRAELREERAKREAEESSGLVIIKGGNKAGLRPLSQTRLNWDRLEDLRRLVQIRGPVQQGMRDEVLFLATCFASWVLAPTSLHLEINALAREFVPGLTASEVHGYTGTALRRAIDAAAGEKVTYPRFNPVTGLTEEILVDPRYRWRNATLIERLQITPDEERQLKTIISPGEAKERDRERHRKHSDRATYLAGAERKRQEARERRSRGEKVKEIAEAMGTTERTVLRYLKGE